MTNSYDLDIGINAEHVALAESVREFTDRHIDAEALRAYVDTADKAPKDPASPVPFWSALAEQGLLGLGVPDELGGQGGGMIELAVALEAFGRAATPGPVLATLLASAVLTEAYRIGDTKQEVLLRAIADGTAIATVGMGAPLDTVDSDGILLVSGVTPVLTAHLAQQLLLPVIVGDTVRYAVIAAESTTIKNLDSLDVVRGTSRVSVDAVALSPESLLSVPPTRVRSLGEVALGAEAVGIASWATAAAAAYANTREQFGRPIGQFQGVKHKCANMAIELEKARALVWDAAVALDDGDDSADFAAAVAGAIAPAAAVHNCQDCIQVHGGIGYTWEHNAHLYYRRALTLRALLGSEDQRFLRVGRQVAAGARRPVVLKLPAESAQLRDTIRAELAQIAALGAKQRPAALGDGGWVQSFMAKPWGRGAGPLEQLVIAEELKTAGISLPQLAMGGWAVQAIEAYGTEEQKQRWIPETLRGETVWCQLFSEPDAGSDLAALTTKAERVDGGWLINGSKIWTSLAHFSKWAMLIARTDRSKPKHEGITYFILDMQSNGVSVKPLKEMSGGAMFNQVFLDDVFVPDENRIGEVDDGWNVARKTLAGERVALSNTKIPLHATIDNLHKLLVGAQLSDTDLIGYGRLVIQDLAGDVLGLRTVLKQLQGTDVSTTSSIGKFISTKISQDIGEFGVDHLGARVALGADDPSRKWGDYLLASRAATIYGGTTEVQLNVIGERLLGLPRDANK